MHDVRTRWLASRTDDVVAAVCGVWMIAGLFTDGWAHRNQKPESFFSPWHGLLYSGFIASAVWMLRVVRRGQERGYTGRNAIPVGYGVRLLGVAVFGAAGLSDFLWHSVFGIEANVEALLSPPHLALLTGGLLLACGPIVSTEAREGATGGLRAAWRSTGPIVMTVTFMLSVMGFFLMYVSPYDHGRYTTRAFDAMAGNGWLIDETRHIGVAAILLFSVLTAIAARWLVKNCPMPRGAWLVLLAVPAVLQSALTSFDTIHRVTGVVVAGLIAELTWPHVQRAGSRVITAVWFGLLTTTGWMLMFGAIAVRDGLAWSAEFWAGSSLFAGLLCAGLFAATTD